MWSGTRVLLTVVAAAALIITVYRTATVLPRHEVLAWSHPSGCWAAMALDLAHGELYRPVHDARGFGGVRYFPLHIVLHASLIAGGIGVIASGHAISLLAALALLAACYVVLRRSGVPIVEAVPLALLPLAISPIQIAITEIRGDLLPAALNLWGLALCLPAADKAPRIRTAALLFALAFLAKETVVFGVVAAALALLLVGERRRAIYLAAWTSAIALAGLIAFQITSHGRFWASLHAGASGGATWRTVVRAPLWLANFIGPGDALWLVLGMSTLLALPAPARRGVLPLAFVTTFVITLIVFGSPGIGGNHFLDVEVAAVLLLATQARAAQLPSPFQLGSLALASIITLASTAQFFARVRWFPVEKLAEEAGSGDGPLLAENPWVAIAAGERPVLLDAMTFHAIASRDPTMAADLNDRLDRRQFRAVILKLPLDFRGAPWAERWYGDLQFHPDFVSHLTANYEVVASHPGLGGADVWRPKRR
jgi:hypothetical protein